MSMNENSCTDSSNEIVLSNFVSTILVGKQQIHVKYNLKVEKEYMYHYCLKMLILIFTAVNM